MTAQREENQKFAGSRNVHLDVKPKKEYLNWEIQPGIPVVGENGENVWRNMGVSTSSGGSLPAKIG